MATPRNLPIVYSVDYADRGTRELLAEDRKVRSALAQTTATLKQRDLAQRGSVASSRTAAAADRAQVASGRAVAATQRSTTQATASATTATRGQTTATHSLTGAQRSAAGVSRAVAGADRAQASASRGLAGAIRSRLAALRGLVTGAREAAAAQRSEAAAARSSAAAHRGFGVAASRTSRSYDQISRSASQAERAQRRATATARAQARGGVARGVSTLGFFGAFGIAGAVRQTVEFDRAMRNVNSIAGLSEKQFKRLSDQVKALGGPNAQQPRVLAEGLYDIVSSGFKAGDAMKILAASAKAATAGLTTTDVSTKAVTAVLNAYHRPAEDARKVSDDLFQTVNLGVVRFDDLASTLGDVLPFASALGVNLKGVGAAITTLTKAGISPEETMTRIKNVMVTMFKPGTDLKKVYEELGVAGGQELVQKMGGGRVGFQRSLEAIVNTTLKADDLKKAYKSLGVEGFDELKKKTGGTSQANRALAQQLTANGSAVAKLFPNIRSLGGALALTGANTRGAEKDLKGFANTTGATQKVFREQSKSTALQWERFKAIAAGIGITIGSKILPVINRLLIGVTKFGREHPTLLKIAGAFVAIAAGIKLIRFTSALLGITDLIRGARTAIRVLAGMRAGATFSEAWGGARAAGGTAAGGGFSGWLSRRRQVPTAPAARGAALRLGEAAAAIAPAAVPRAGRLARIAPRLVRGVGPAALIGGTAAMIGGSAIGGKTGQAVSNIGTGAAVGATVGSFIPVPVAGTAVGAAAGAGVGALMTKSIRSALLKGLSNLPGFIAGHWKQILLIGFGGPIGGIVAALITPKLRGAVGKALGAVGGQISEWAGSIGGFFAPAGQAVAGVARTIASPFASIFTGAFNVGRTAIGVGFKIWRTAFLIGFAAIYLVGRTAFRPLIALVTAGVRAFSTVARPALRVLTTVFSAAFRGLRAVVSTAINAVGRAWSAIRSVFGGPARVAVRGARAALGGLDNVASSVARKATRAAGAAWDIVSTLTRPARRAVSAVVGVLGDLAGKAAAAMGRVVSRIAGVIGTLPGKIRDALSGLGGAIGSIGRSLANWLNDNTPLGDKVSAGPIHFTLPSLRGGGTISAGMGGGRGMVDVLVSPGEVGVLPGGQAFRVPGARTAADNVHMRLPERTAILTGHGQSLVAGGYSLDEAMGAQMPHFRIGGVVRPGERHRTDRSVDRSERTRLERTHDRTRTDRRERHVERDRLVDRERLVDRRRDRRDERRTAVRFERVVERFGRGGVSSYREGLAPVALGRVERFQAGGQVGRATKVASALRGAGERGNRLFVLTATSGRESRWSNVRGGRNNNGTFDWGPLQINDIWKRDRVISRLWSRRLTYEGNARMAHRVAQVQGPSAWRLPGWRLDSTISPFASTAKTAVARSTSGRRGSDGADARARTRLSFGARPPSRIRSFAAGYQAGLEGTRLWDTETVRQAVQASTARLSRAGATPRSSGSSDGKKLPADVARSKRWLDATVGRGYPYKYGGGHGAIGQPSGGGFDCSGLVSGGLGAGGFLRTPLATDGLQTWGRPGTGKFLTVGVRGTTGRQAHTAMVIGDTGYESGGSGGGPHKTHGWPSAFPIKRHPLRGRAGGEVTRATVRRPVRRALSRAAASLARVVPAFRLAPLETVERAASPASPTFVGWGLRAGGVVTAGRSVSLAPQPRSLEALIPIGPMRFQAGGWIEPEWDGGEQLQRGGVIRRLVRATRRVFGREETGERTPGRELRGLLRDTGRVVAAAGPRPRRDRLAHPAAVRTFGPAGEPGRGRLEGARRDGARRRDDQRRPVDHVRGVRLARLPSPRRLGGGLAPAARVVERFRRGGVAYLGAGGWVERPDELQRGGRIRRLSRVVRRMLGGAEEVETSARTQALRRLPLLRLRARRLLEAASGQPRGRGTRVGLVYPRPEGRARLDRQSRGRGARRRDDHRVAFDSPRGRLARISTARRLGVGLAPTSRVAARIQRFQDGGVVGIAARRPVRQGHRIDTKVDADVRVDVGPLRRLLRTLLNLKVGANARAKAALRGFAQAIEKIDDTTRAIFEDRLGVVQRAIRPLARRVRQRGGAPALRRLARRETRIERGGVTRRERPRLRALRRRIAPLRRGVARLRGLRDEAREIRGRLDAPPSFRDLERQEGRIEGRIRQVRRGGVHGRGERVELRRLQAALGVVETEMGRRAGLIVANVDKQGEALERARNQLSRSLRVRGIDESSARGLTELAGFSRISTEVLRRQETALQTALKRALRAGDATAVRDITERLTALRESISDATADWVEQSRAAVAAAAQERVDTGTFLHSLAGAQQEGFELDQRLAGTFDTGASARAENIKSNVIPAIEKEMAGLRSQFLVAVMQGNTELARSIVLQLVQGANDVKGLLADIKDASEQTAENTKEKGTGNLAFDVKGSQFSDLASIGVGK